MPRWPGRWQAWCWRGCWCDFLKSVKEDGLPADSLRGAEEAMTAQLGEAPDGLPADSLQGAKECDAADKADEVAKNRVGECSATIIILPKEVTVTSIYTRKVAICHDACSAGAALYRGLRRFICSCLRANSLK